MAFDFSKSANYNGGQYKGKKIGTYIGRVVVRAKGRFDIGIGKKKVSGISYKYLAC
jgi:lipoate-protein ligase A